MLPPPPTSTLFPYTTLFRSARPPPCDCLAAGCKNCTHAPSHGIVGISGDKVGISLQCVALQSQSIAFLRDTLDRKSTRLNSSHTVISYAVFCLKKKKLLSAT